MKQVTCEECGKLMSSEEVLRKHKLMYHPAPGVEVKYYPCNYCDYKSRFKQNTRKHMENSHNNGNTGMNERLQCEYCPNTFKNKNSLIIHVGSSHDTGTSTITCE